MKKSILVSYILKSANQLDQNQEFQLADDLTKIAGKLASKEYNKFEQYPYVKDPYDKNIDYSQKPGNKMKPGEWRYPGHQGICKVCERPFENSYQEEYCSYACRNEGEFENKKRQAEFEDGEEARKLAEIEADDLAHGYDKNEDYRQYSWNQAEPGEGCEGYCRLCERPYTNSQCAEFCSQECAGQYDMRRTNDPRRCWKCRIDNYWHNGDECSRCGADLPESDPYDDIDDD